jgi:Family of unknown function (DUF6152)
MEANEKKSPIMAATMIAILMAAPGFAHHSFAMFDNEKTLTLEGTIKEFQWTNPHCWVQLLVTAPSGAVVEWSIEGTSPNRLARMGWKLNSLKPGDKATVVIHPLKDGTTGGSMMTVTVDGKVVGAPAGPPVGGPVGTPN